MTAISARPADLHQLSHLGAQVWWGRSEAVLFALRHVPYALADYERRRAAQFRMPSDRLDYEAAHGLVRWCAAQLTGDPLSAHHLEQRCAQCGGPHGAPRLLSHPHIHVSLSHMRGWVAAAADVHPVGVDIEGVPACAEAWLTLPIWHPAERSAVKAWASTSSLRHALTRFWTAKEALIKLGFCSIEELDQVDVSGTLGWSPARQGTRSVQPVLRSWTDDRSVIAGTAAFTRRATEDARLHAGVRDSGLLSHGRASGSG